MNDKEEITISINKNEAIVLFEFVSRFTNTGDLKLEHQAERIALWNLCAILEKNLVEPFAHDYEKILSEARQAVSAEKEE